MDRTDATAVSTNAAAGKGAMACSYSFLASISGTFNGSINADVGSSFTNTPGNQEIALITGAIGQSSMLQTPGIDPLGESNIGTWSGYGVGATPTNGSTAPVDASIGNVYFGTGA